ncbi:MAG: hypothetical protein Kow006_02330 [Gammaproteobacteria bacterium]
MITRRALLKWGVTGAAGLAFGCSGFGGDDRGESFYRDPDHPYRFLTDEDQIIVAAIAPVMLGEALPADPAAHRERIREVVRGVDYAISLLSEATRDELRDLFGLLGNSLGRVIIAGLWSRWDRAGPAEVGRFLNDWRLAYLDLLRQGYQGLHELIMAAWYGNPASWPDIGYPGPPEV